MLPLPFVDVIGDASQIAGIALQAFERLQGPAAIFLRQPHRFVEAVKACVSAALVPEVGAGLFSQHRRFANNIQNIVFNLE